MLTSAPYASASSASARARGSIGGPGPIVRTVAKAIASRLPRRDRSSVGRAPGRLLERRSDGRSGDRQRDRSLAVEPRGGPVVDDLQPLGTGLRVGGRVAPDLDTQHSTPEGQPE